MAGDNVIDLSTTPTLRQAIERAITKQWPSTSPNAQALTLQGNICTVRCRKGFKVALIKYTIFFDPLTEEISSTLPDWDNMQIIGGSSDA